MPRNQRILLAKIGRRVLEVTTAISHRVTPLKLHITLCKMGLRDETMPTNLAIDDRLIDEARKLGRHRTKKETVTAALDEYIKRRKQQQVISLFGTIDYDPDYDYKRARRKKRS